jgi:hypothetical protein
MKELSALSIKMREERMKILKDNEEHLEEHANKKDDDEDSAEEEIDDDEEVDDKQDKENAEQVKHILSKL